MGKWRQKSHIQILTCSLCADKFTCRASRGEMKHLSSNCKTHLKWGNCVCWDCFNDAKTRCGVVKVEEVETE